MSILQSDTTLSLTEIVMIEAYRECPRCDRYPNLTLRSGQLIGVYAPDDNPVYAYCKCRVCGRAIYSNGNTWETNG